MLRPWLCLLAPLLALQMGRGFETNFSFSGSLERVGDKSVSIRLADRRVIDAMLPNSPALAAAAIANEYDWGDRVEILCKPIRPVWEEGTSRYQSLQVVTLRLVRQPSPEELSRMRESRPFREGKNLLRVPKRPVPVRSSSEDLSGPGSRELEHARRINLEFGANMPNFVADETAKRFRSTKSPDWRRFDTIESEITFRGNRAVRQHIRKWKALERAV